MALDGTEQLYLERQIILGRAILAALSLVALLETSGPALRKSSVMFLAAYLLLALAGVLVDRLWDGARFRIPLLLDFAVLAAFLYLTPSVLSFLVSFPVCRFRPGQPGQQRQGHFSPGFQRYCGDYSSRGASQTCFAGKASGTGWPSDSEPSFPAWAWGFWGPANGSIWRGSSSLRPSPATCNSTGA